MTTRRKAAAARLRIVQVRSQIGNQTRVKRVLTDGLGLGRIGSSVVLPDNSYTRGMIAKVGHIVSFEEMAAEAQAVRAGEHRPAAEERAAEPVSPAVEAPMPVAAGAPPAVEAPVEAKPKAVPAQTPAEPEKAGRQVTRAPRPHKAEKAPKAAKPERAPKAAKASPARAKAGERKPKAAAKATAKPAAKRPAKKVKE